jgi:RNA polymerase sigma-70 factor, ECF subfamily
MEQDDRKQDFFLEFSKYQAQIHAYIASQIPVFSDSQDVLQETSLALWENFDQYVPGTNFLAWARKVAHFRILRYRQKCSRDRLYFSDEISQLLEETINQKADYLENRLDALQLCMNKLGQNERDIFEKCYSKELSIKDAALTLGRKVKGLYKTMARLRKIMSNCVDAHFKVEKSRG